MKGEAMKKKNLTVNQINKRHIFSTVSGLLLVAKQHLDELDRIGGMIAEWLDEQGDWRDGHISDFIFGGETNARELMEKVKARKEMGKR